MDTSEIIKLVDGGSVVEIDSHGAGIVSWKHNGTDVMFPRTEIDGKVRGYGHPCSPFGKKESPYDRIAQHGPLRDMFWQVRDRSNNAVILDTQIGEDQGSYFPASWLVRYDLFSHARLWVTAMVKNMSEQRVPIEFADHPYFNATNGGTVSFVGTAIKPLMIDGAFEATKYDIRDEVFITLPGIGWVTMRFREGLANQVVCVWSDGRGPYFCVEPAAPHPAKFNTPDGLWLSPGQERKFQFILEFHPKR